MFTRLVLKRTMATIASRPVAQASDRYLESLLGLVLVTPAIAFAPANTFDNLDCNSECQRKIWEGLEN